MIRYCNFSQWLYLNIRRDSMKVRLYNVWMTTKYHHHYVWERTVMWVYYSSSSKIQATVRTWTRNDNTEHLNIFLVHLVTNSVPLIWKSPCKLGQRQSLRPEAKLWILTKECLICWKVVNKEIIRQTKSVRWPPPYKKPHRVDTINRTLLPQKHTQNVHMNIIPSPRMQFYNGKQSKHKYLH